LFVAALAALAAVLLTGGAPDASASRCSTYETRALIAGRVVCLGEAGICRPGFQSAYSRYGFRCGGGTLSITWRGLHRRLRIPSIPAGAACPASTASGTLGAEGNTDATLAPAFGPGPAFPTLQADNGRAYLSLTWSPSDQPYAGWFGTKALWTVPRASGPVLVRGGQLDGMDPVGFDIGPSWTSHVLSEIRLVGPDTILHPAATFVRAPGCYAYQIDTARSSYLIVFEARSA
jgi:hypothetical protein